MDNKTIQKRIYKAREVREKGNLKESRKLFEELIKDFEKLGINKLSKSFQKLYTTAFAEYVIQYRLEAKALEIKALDLGEKLLKYDKENKIGNPMSIRSVSNVLIDLQEYERAINLLKRMILMYKNNPARRGDTRAHLANCLLKSGQTKEAEKEIDRAIKEILKKPSPGEYITIKHSYALMVKALILNARGLLSEAVASAEESMKIAKSENRVFRMKQAKELLEFLKSKAKK